MKGGHDQMKGRCGFYSKLEYSEGVVEEFEGGSWRVRGGSFPPAPPVDETLPGYCVEMHIQLLA